MSKVEKTITEMRTVRVHFTKEEQEKHATELAKAVSLKQEAEAAKKSAMADFKAKIDSQDAVMGMFSRYIANGYDYRSVECVVKKDFDKGIKEFYYEGVLVDTVKMTEADNQLSITE